MNGLRKGLQRRAPAPAGLEVGESAAGQRVDNFLARALKGVPKSHLYRILRTGQVRVNSRRVDATYRLQAGDRVRIPPVRTAAVPAGAPSPPPPSTDLSGQVVLENDWFILLDKPSGIAAHGGSGISRGVIELMRAQRPELRFLELVHRLDRGTSGLMLLAKKRGALTSLHAQLRDGQVRKRYLVLARGDWVDDKRAVRLPVLRRVTASGERRVGVAEGGMAAHTVFRRRQNFTGFTLLEAELLTGRTHQIRVHLAHLGYPVAGDDKYGDFALNKALARTGLKRMFLHASRLEFRHPGTHELVSAEAPLPAALQVFLKSLGSRAWALAAAVVRD